MSENTLKKLFIVLMTCTLVACLGMILFVSSTTAFAEESIASSNGVVVTEMEIMAEVLEEPEIVIVPKTDADENIPALPDSSPVGSAKQTNGVLPPTGETGIFALSMLLAGIAILVAGSLILVRGRK